MKSTSMGREVPQDELEFLAFFPHVTLRGKDDVKYTCLHLCEPLHHGKPNAAQPHIALPQRQAEMLLLTTHEGRRPGNFHAARQQHRLRVTLTEGFELLDEL